MATDNSLTVADIQRCFLVDVTGTVRWKSSVEPVQNCALHWFSGTVAGGLTELKPSGLQYRRIKYTKRGKVQRVYAHVIAFVLHNSKFPDGQVDHLDGDGCNNAGSNLRDVTRRVNICNAKLNRRNVSGVKGVIPVKQCPGMWQSSARVNGKRHHLFYGDDFLLAVCARKSFEARHDHADVAYSGQTYRKTNPQAGVLRKHKPTDGS